MTEDTTEMQADSSKRRIDVHTAVELINAAMPDFGAETVLLETAGGRVLRQTIHAERDQPPFDRATMDGIAVAGSSFDAGQREFRIAGIQAAGQAQQSLPDAGHCYEIMTGAVLPIGTDTVIPVEQIHIDQDLATLASEYVAAPGQFVHRRASDHAKQDLLLNPGIRINGPDMAILTAAGEPEVQVAADPAIAVIATGDELVDVGESISDHQIRSSNDRAIETALLSRGYRHITRSTLPDDPDALLEQIHRLHMQHEVLILSGGVSMGKYDYVPAILSELGVELIFHKILQRPGLPMWFGVSNDDKPVFALPGNPVSTLVCLIRYVLPALDYASGQAPENPEFVPLSGATEFAPDLCWFLPIKLNNHAGNGWKAQPRPTNTSGDFIGLRGTDGFVELPRGQASFPAGYKARLFRW